jgi:hypothetical protein
MNFKKMFSFTGMLILGIVAVFAAARKPNSTLTTVYYTSGGQCFSFDIGAGSSNFTTGAFSGTQAKILTKGGVSRLLYGFCSSGTVANQVHFNQ